MANHPDATNSSQQPRAGGGEDMLVAGSFADAASPGVVEEKAYGAIKELADFIDPNVLKDEEFQLDTQTAQKLATVQQSPPVPLRGDAAGRQPAEAAARNQQYVQMPR